MRLRYFAEVDLAVAVRAGRSTSGVTSACSGRELSEATTYKAVAGQTGCDSGVFPLYPSAFHPGAEASRGVDAVAAEADSYVTFSDAALACRYQTMSCVGMTLGLKPYRGPEP